MKQKQNLMDIQKDLRAPLIIGIAHSEHWKSKIVQNNF
jgi:hypothetical protein